MARAYEVTTRDGRRVVATTARGREVLADPFLNKGSGFDPAERRELGLDGLVPAGTAALEVQADRAYGQFAGQPDDLAKNVFLTSLRESNEVLFYALFARHLTEMMPIVYDPTVGQAIEQYSHVFRQPRGVFLSVDDPDGVDAALAASGMGADDVDLIVATDAEEILGIGDWGAGGIDIAIGKLAVYTAAAGIDPSRVLPVMLDVGTDRQSLLQDPLYVGYRHARVRGERYDALIEAYVTAATTRFPNALLHWEDFGPGNGRRILEHYRDRVATFNDDMQGTGAISMAAFLNALAVSGTQSTDHQVVVFGAGTAGVGIADQLRAQMERDGLSRDEATARIWLVDRQGLLVDDMDGLRDYQQPYARPRAEVDGWTATGPEGALSLADTVAGSGCTALIGTSTAPHTFTREIVQAVGSHTDRPFIFPLSNPTPLAEATPEQILTWTGGRALVATGSPFAPVHVHGTTHAIGQANNALLYPGLGLGTIVARASKVTDGMILAAARAVASTANLSSAGAALLPPVHDLRAVSATVGVEVARQAIADGVARADLDPEGLIETVRAAMWEPVYSPLVAK